MSNFTDWRDQVTSRKIYLAEAYPAQHLIDWTKTGGYSYVYELEIAALPHLSHLPQFEDVTENGTSLTERASVALVEANAGSWHFDQSAAKIYIHATGSDDPDGMTGGKYDYSILGYFYIYFGSEAKIFSSNYYYPRIAEGGLSDLTVSTRTIYFGTQAVGNGSLRLKNEDRFFDALLKRYIWQNKFVEIKLGGDDLAYADYQTIFRGWFLDWSGNDNEITFRIKDYRSILQRNLPTNTFTVENYANIGEGVEGEPIPVCYGYLENAPAYLIDATAQKGKYKFADHEIVRVFAVYDNGNLVAATKYAVDRPNGELTISNTYAGTPGAITVDFYGYPGSTVIFSDDFEDADFSDWTESSTGAGASWVESGGKVRATTPSGIGGFAIAPEEFASGEIEVDITPQSGADNWLGAGIIFDYQDTSNYSAVYLYPNMNKIRLYEVIGGTANQRADASVTLSLGTEYALKVDISSDGYLTGYVDDVSKITYDYGSGFALGNAGMIHASNGYSDFDDFSFTLDYMGAGADIVEDICATWLGIDSGDIDSSSFATAAANAAEALAVHIGSREEAATVIERICRSNLCRFVIGTNGKVFYQWWNDSETASDEIEKWEILGDYSAEEKETEIFDECLVKWGRGAGTQWSASSYTDPQVQHLYGRDAAKEFETYLLKQADADDLSFRLFKLLRQPATRYSVRTKTRGIDLKVGDLVALSRDRGISISGKHSDTEFRIVGISKNFSKMETRLDLVSNSAALGEGLCDVGCQTTCELVCQETCMIGCQEICKLTCQGTCQVGCEAGCQVTCEVGCEVTCEEACTAACVTGCELACELCEGQCEEACIEACVTACEIGCQATCELSCETACKLGCQIGCEQACIELCQQECQTGE